MANSYNSSTSAPRINISSNTQIALFNQVDGICPLCLVPLQYKKHNGRNKLYQIAHIYPLNPSAKEIELLSKAERLTHDINHEDNLIPLCANCHTKFDKPRTLDEYNDLLRIKKNCLNKERQHSLWHNYNIEHELKYIIDKLTNNAFQTDEKIDYEAKTVDEKIRNDESIIFLNKVKSHVTDYYGYIKNLFKYSDSMKPGSAELIASQIKGYYLKQQQTLSQEQIYHNISEWIFVKTGSTSRIAAEILTSFFVQNCEVFSDSSK